MEFVRPKLLRGKLEAIKSSYDFVLIDPLPSSGILTINTLTAADSVIVPMSAYKLRLQGLSRLYNTVEMVRRHSNPGLEIKGLLFT